MPDNTNTILRIGGVDMTVHVICEAMNIDTEAVWSDGFTAVSGKEKKRRMGDRVSLSAEFRILDRATAAAVVSACNADTVTVVYRCPDENSAIFDRPSVTVVPVFEDGITSYWNVSVSMVCPLKGDGL